MKNLVTSIDEENEVMIKNMAHSYLCEALTVIYQCNEFSLCDVNIS